MISLLSQRDVQIAPELSGNAKQTLIREATVGLGIHAHLHVHPNDLGL